MAAYAVLARIDRVDPQLAGWAAVGPAPATEDWLVAEPPEPPEAIEIAGSPLVPILAERWTGLREAWTQTTFYLFHTEGWR
jgi:hypothetical protein